MPPKANYLISNKFVFEHRKMQDEQAAFTR